MSDTEPIKNSTLTLTITEVNNLGCGIGHAPDGRVVFVRGALTGETVEILLIKVNAHYLVGKPLRVLSPSPYRLPADAPDCGAPESCGGCTYRHLTYDHELLLKEEYVRNAFRKAGLSDVLVEKAQTTGEIYGYRNKGQYPVAKIGGKIRAGFFAPGTHTVHPAEHCLLQPPMFGAILTDLCNRFTAEGVSVYDEQTGKGLLRHIYLRQGRHSGQIMVCLVINSEKWHGSTAFCADLAQKYPAVVSILLNHNTANTNVVLGDRFTTLYGTPYIEDTLCGKQFRIAPDAFYQVNSVCTELLYGIAAQKAQLSGSETLVDLYCGIGTVGLSMAESVKKLIGVEIVPAAVACAKENANVNGVKDAVFLCADAGSERILDAVQDPIDVLVMDPPRKGSTPALIHAIAARAIPRVVYISCDPDTLARDCATFREEGYSIGTVTPVNMFPRTGHVESCVELYLKTNQK